MKGPDAEAYYGLGLLYERLDDLNSAKKHLRKARSYAKYPELEELIKDELKSLARH